MNCNSYTDFEAVTLINFLTFPVDTELPASNEELPPVSEFMLTASEITNLKITARLVSNIVDTDPDSSKYTDFYFKSFENLSTKTLLIYFLLRW